MNLCLFTSWMEECVLCAVVVKDDASMKAAEWLRSCRSVIAPASKHEENVKFEQNKFLNKK